MHKSYKSFVIANKVKFFALHKLFDQLHVAVGVVLGKARGAVLRAANKGACVAVITLGDAVKGVGVEQSVLQSLDGLVGVAHLCVAGGEIVVHLTQSAMIEQKVSVGDERLPQLYGGKVCRQHVFGRHVAHEVHIHGYAVQIVKIVLVFSLNFLVLTLLCKVCVFKQIFATAVKSGRLVGVFHRLLLVGYRIGVAGVQKHQRLYREVACFAVGAITQNALAYLNRLFGVSVLLLKFTVDVNGSHQGVREIFKAVVVAGVFLCRLAPHGKPAGYVALLRQLLVALVKCFKFGVFFGGTAQKLVCGYVEKVGESNDERYIGHRFARFP